VIFDSNTQKSMILDFNPQAFMIFDINTQTSEAGFSRMALIRLMIVAITSP